MSTSVEVLCKGYPSECGGRKEGVQLVQYSKEHNSVEGEHSTFSRVRLVWYRLAVVCSLD